MSSSKKIDDFAAGVYLSDSPPLLWLHTPRLHTVYVYTVYFFTQGRVGGEIEPERR